MWQAIKSSTIRVGATLCLLPGLHSGTSIRAPLLRSDKRAGPGDTVRRGPLCGLLCCLFLCCLLGHTGCQPQVEHEWEDAVEERDVPSLLAVRDVLTGDTICLEDGRIVKYLGIQAPHEGEPGFEESRQANRYLLRGGKVLLQFDRPTEDDEGHNLAYVHSPCLGVYCFVNQELLQYGFARLAESPTRHKYWKEFQVREEIARHNQKGIWANAQNNSP